MLNTNGPAADRGMDWAGAGLGSPGERPLAVEVARGPLVESRHLVDAVVVDVDGGVVAAWGEQETPVYPRSACKPLQALPLLESGAADAFALQNKQIAMACASHNGEQIHVETALDWLERLGLSDDDLECGGHYSRHAPTLEAFIKSGEPLRQANSNCSGKHSGMLSHAVHLGDDPKGYVNAEHPVQRRITRTLEIMYGVSLSQRSPGIDGCSIPTHAVPLPAMAVAMAKLGAPDKLPDELAAACRRITAAMMAEPYMVAGADRCCTAVLTAGREQSRRAQGGQGGIIVKTGAEGIFMAALPGLGLGIALKVRDGAGRASECALLSILRGLGALDEQAQTDLRDYLSPELRNVRGRSIGGLKTVVFGATPGF